MMDIVRALIQEYFYDKPGPVNHYGAGMLRILPAHHDQLEANTQCLDFSPMGIIESLRPVNDRTVAKEPKCKRSPEFEYVDKRLKGLRFTVDHPNRPENLRE
jgi:hypothetical protein